jgi:hypothetical protein
MFVMTREIEGTCGEIKMLNPHGEEARSDLTTTTVSSPGQAGA